MAYLDPQEAFEAFRDGVVDSLKTQFPLEGKAHTIHLEGIDVPEKLHPDSVRDQQKSKTDGKTWAEDVYGTVVLKDNVTDKVIEKKRMRMAEIPRMTKRYSYIVGGQEYQVDNQWQLKPGAYARRRQQGELEVQFNTQGGKSFDMMFDPAKKKFEMEWNKAKVPAYPVLKAMGVSDETLKKTWGAELLEANQNARGTAGTLQRMYKADKGTSATPEQAEEYIKEQLKASGLNPDATKRTLGKELDHVDGDALHLATKRLLDMQAGGEEDDRDSLVFKRLRTASDFAQDKMRANNWRARSKMIRKLDGSAKGVRDVLKFDHFNTPLVKTFNDNQASRVASQINPLEMVSASMQTTVMGPGGIKSEHGIVDETKFINTSHFGYLDPINTPEGSKTGVSLRLPLGVKKIGDDPMVPLYNLHTNKMEMVPPTTMMTHDVVLPDQVDWTGKTPKMAGKTVKMFSKDNELKEGDGSKAKYAMRYPTQVFNLTSNLIPFLHSTQGNRAGMATRHMEQAISLKEREKPLVQVSTGFDKGDVRSFEQLVGKQAGHIAPLDGTIKKITKDGIHIQGKDGATHEVQMYNNYPLTDAKSLLHSDPTVKVGQKVAKGQNVADTNYSKDGHLALGTNMRVAYLPYRGYNFEDGIVISDSAAKKLSSEHMQKLDIKVDEKTTVDRGMFGRKHSGTFNKEQLAGVGEDGVVKVGQKVRPGDPLVLATAPFQIKDRVGLGAIRKSLSGVHSDKSLKWKSDFGGEVVAVHKKKDGLQVHVRSTEPMQVGDKLCFDEQTEVLTESGWKPMADVTFEDRVCCLRDGSIEYEHPTGLHAYPHGGRMYRIKSQQIDLFVTENHRMYVKPRTIKKSLDKFALLPASEIVGKRVRYKKNGEWEGELVDEFVLPPLRVLAGQYGRGVRTLPEMRMPMSTYLMLLGMYLSDGNIVNQPTSGSYGIAITQVKEPNRTELRQVLEALDIKYSNGSNGTKVCIYSKQLMEHFKMFGYAGDKYIPQEVFSLPKQQLSILFSWLMWGDGHDNGKLSVCYHTISKRLAGDVQRLCLHMGIAANISETEARWETIKGVRYWCETAYRVGIVTTKLEPQVNHGHTKEQKVQEEYWVEEYRNPVYCVTVPSHVLYVRRNGKSVWSGNSGRHGNKGIVTKIMPDAEMPRTKDGKPIQVALNPFGVPGRLNPSQIIETVTAKVAEKIGRPIAVKNFGTKDQIRETKALAKKHGVVDAEELHDPVTGQNLGKVTVGPQYMLKLVHQVEKKGAVRSGMATPGGEQEKYDQNLMPGQGGHHGGQAIGSLGLYALLAHGAKANIREMQTFKSEGEDPQTNPSKKWKGQHKKVWESIQMGTPVPTPKPTFAFEKFTSYMKAAGVNMDKKGHNFVLSPMTDGQVKNLSTGALPAPDMKLSYKLNDKGEPAPIKGGLFDESLTGGHGGKKWTHIRLAEPVPNPMFEKAIKSITGLKKKDYDGVVYGEKAVLPNGQLTDKLDQGTTGGAGIKMLLGNIDVDSHLKKAKEELGKAPETKVDPALKKVKYLQALKKVGMKAEEAYILHNLPVIPPAMRPASLMQDGSINEADLNGLYSQFATTNRQLGDPKLRKYEQAEDRKETRREFYDGVRAIMGVGVPYADQKQKGLLHQIHGPFPKSGMFQDGLNNRRQDLTMRSTIVPEPSLGLDEVGLPKQYASTLFKPFIVKKMQQMGHAKHALEAQALIDKKDPRVDIALEKVMEERPVIMKRDPVLHKYGLQGHKPRLVEGSAIKIHPLTCSGYNADFDGDTMSMFVPVTDEAQQEARKMMPSANLFSESTGRVMYSPGHEGAAGLYKLGRVSKKDVTKVKSAGEAVDLVRKGKIDAQDRVSFGGKITTPGRVLVSATLPDSMQEKVLTDLKTGLNKSKVAGLLKEVGKNHKGEFGNVADRLNDLGNGASFGAAPVLHSDHLGADALDPKKKMWVPTKALTLTLDDFDPDRGTRDRLMAVAGRKVQGIKKLKTTEAEKERRTVDAWSAADRAIQVLHEVKAKRSEPNNLQIMKDGAGKPSLDQYKQLAMAPMLVQDTGGRVIPVPITKSFGEGLDVSQYWTGMYGARRGLVRKVQEVQDPGVLSKMMQNTAMDQVVASNDCGTGRGVAMPVTDKEIHDRVLAAPLRAGKMELRSGTILTPDLVGQVRASKKDAMVVVRSPLKCEHEQGICQKCMGLGPDGQHPEIGTNVGVQATHALGEPTTQLMMRSFHTGGVVGKANVSDQFKHVENLMKMPDKIDNQATLSLKSGTVEKIEKDRLGTRVWVGGTEHFVGKDRYGVDLHAPPVKAFDNPDYEAWQVPKVGMKIKPGQSLSDPNRTVVNPKDLYRATGNISVVQNHLTSGLHDMFGPEGVRRVHSEVMVRAMTGSTKVQNPGGHPDILRGEVHNASRIRSINRDLKKHNQKPIVHAPHLKGIDMLPLSVRDDWMAKLQHTRLRDTLVEASAQGASSNIHGTHPIPGVAYGAEFGFNEKHSLRPGFEKYKNVPKYSY